MFCPEGYIPLSTLWRSLLRNEHGFLEHFEQAIADNVAENLRSGLGAFFAATAEDQLERQLLASTRGAACICGPSGQVLRLDINEALYAQDHSTENANFPAPFVIECRAA